MDTDRLRWALDHVAEHGFGDNVDADSIIEEAAKDALNPKVTRITVSEWDVIYGLLDEVRDDIISSDDGGLVDGYRAVIDEALAKFPDPASLWKWGGSCIDANASSKVDDDHDWWSAEANDAEEYAEQRVKEILQ